MNKTVPQTDEALSFVTRRKPRGTGFEYWSLAPSGSYAADCERGRAASRELLEYIGKHPTNGNMTLLGAIVNEMVQKGEAQASRGHVVGFMAGITEALVISAVMLHNAKQSGIPSSGTIGGAILEWLDVVGQKGGEA